MPGEDESGFGAGQLTELPGELKKWADAIKAATEAIDAVSNLLDAPRSVLLEVNNTTSQLLRIEGSGDHDWGVFRDNPPFEISPGTSAVFSSQSDRPLTGTQGNVRYHVDDEGTIFHLEWNVPFVGGNESHCRVEGRRAGWYIANSITGGGNTRAPMRYMIGEGARANKKSSPDWRTCAKCKLLCFALDDGHCAGHPLGITSAPSDDMLRQAQAPRTPLPGGLQRRRLGGEGSPPPPPPPPETAAMPLFGKHDAAGHSFCLPFGVSGPNREGGWRTCAHCRALFWAASEPQGVCPGRRGGHVVEAGAHEFQLVRGVPPGPLQQDNWRFCDKCYGLFYFPHNADAACPAGADHHAHGPSGSYVLDHQG